MIWGGSPSFLQGISRQGGSIEFLKCYCKIGAFQMLPGKIARRFRAQAVSWWDRLSSSIPRSHLRFTAISVSSIFLKLISGWFCSRVTQQILHTFTNFWFLKCLSLILARNLTLPLISVVLAIKSAFPTACKIPQDLSNSPPVGTQVGIWATRTRTQSASYVILAEPTLCSPGTIESHLSFQEHCHGLYS